MSEYFTKYTLLLMYYAFVGINDKLYTMHGTYIKITMINVSSSLRMGSKRYPETSYLSYNVMPRRNPKVLQHQFHRGASLRSHPLLCFLHFLVWFGYRSYRRQTPTVLCCELLCVLWMSAHWKSCLMVRRWIYVDTLYIIIRLWRNSVRNLNV